MNSLVPCPSSAFGKAFFLTFGLEAPDAELSEMCTADGRSGAWLEPSEDDLICALQRNDVIADIVVDARPFPDSGAA